MSRKNGSCVYLPLFCYYVFFVLFMFATSKASWRWILILPLMMPLVVIVAWIFLVRRVVVESFKLLVE